MTFKDNLEDFNKTGVYCITNTINNKIYIGSTSVSFRQRYSQHKWDYKKNKGNVPILHKAFDKYGFDNFTFHILCICKKEDCIKMEQFYIDKGSDYNACLIAGSLLGLKHSENSKTKTIIKGAHHCAVKVNKYDKKGNFIKTYTSIIEACEANNIKSKSNIVQCCKGKVFSSGGFRWSYKNKPLIKRASRVGKFKIALKKENFYKEFNSQSDAANYLVSLGFKANQGRISRSLNKSKEKVYGYEVIKIENI